jgi:hypothetical protein
MNLPLDFQMAQRATQPMIFPCPATDRSWFQLLRWS